MKNEKIIIIIVIISFILLSIIGYIYEVINNDNETAINNNIVNSNTINTSPVITEEQEEKIYEADETINKFITKFNSIYSNNSITSDMLSIYNHHGSAHKDQAKLELEGLSIIISSLPNNKVSIYIDNTSDNNTIVQSLIKKFIKVFNSSITDENIDNYINSQGAGNSIDTYDNIEYWTNKDAKGERILYIKITSKLKD